MTNDHLDLQSPDLVAQNIDKIAALFPNCLTEGPDGKVVDFDLLRQELNYAVVEGTKERYRLEWPGKREAIVTANLPTTKTLRPVREDSVDFDNTENLYIEGDNLEVLKLLQESYLGKIKMIYIDPPYNTGKDFVYKDNFTKDNQEELFESGQKDEYNQRLVVNPETAGRYHSDWLSMMYPRLKLARNLLTEDGAIFISIDDNEVHNLRKVCDEIFDESNNAGQIVWQRSKKGDSKLIAKTHEYVLAYVKNKAVTIENGPWRKRKEGVDEVLAYYDKLKQKYTGIHEKIEYEIVKWFNNLKDGDPRKDHKHYKCSDDRGLYFPDNFAGPNDGRESRPRYDIMHPITGKSCKKPFTGWRWDEKRTVEALEAMPPLIHFGKDETTIPCRKSYLKKTAFEPFSSVFYKDGRSSSKIVDDLVGKNVFDFPKDIDVLKNLIELSVENNDIVLDFFSGSSSSAHAILKMNAHDLGKRKFIQVQLPEETGEKSEAYKAGYKNICEIGKERIRRAAKKIKEELQAKQQQQQGKLDFEEDTRVDISKLDFGFRVYRLDSSNMQDVYYRPQDYKQEAMELFADNIKADRTPDDLLAQVMLDWGLPLSLKIEQQQLQGKLLFKVAGNSLYACFDDGINEAFAKAIAPEHPLRMVFRDKGFSSDTAKVNVKQLLKQLSPETEMKVI